MPKWLVSFILEKEESTLSEADLEAIIQSLLEINLSDSECSATVRSITVREVRRE